MPVWHYLALHMQQQGDSVRLSDIAARLGLDNKLGRPVNQLSSGDILGSANALYPYCFALRMHNQQFCGAT